MTRCDVAQKATVFWEFCPVRNSETKSPNATEPPFACTSQAWPALRDISAITFLSLTAPAAQLFYDLVAHNVQQES